MAYGLMISDRLDKIFGKLLKKDRKQLEIINKKVEEIRENPTHYKPLRGDMAGTREVHIDKSFVLTYEIDGQNKTVRLLDYDHHDKIYQ